MGFYHDKFKAEGDIEELRKVGLACASEIELLQRRMANLTNRLAEATGVSIAELFEQEAAAHESAMARGNKWGRGSLRSTKNRRRDNKGKKKPPIAKAPREEQVVLELDDADRVCPDCGGDLVHRPTLDDESTLITLERTLVIQYDVTRHGYGCARCEHVEHALPHEEQFVPGGRYGLALIVQMIVFKYWQSMPLNRQVKFFADHGLDITTQTMWDNLWLASRKLKPVYDALLDEAQGASIAHADETRWNVRGGKGKAWVWTLATETAVIFMIRKGRDNTVADELLKNFGGFLMTDAMSAYTTFVNNRNKARDNPELWDSGKPPPLVIRVGCWAHARSYWAEAAEHFPAKADLVIDAIGKLYRIVGAANEHELPLNLRRLWIDSALAFIKKQVELMEVLPGTSLEDAKRYTLNQWDRLTVFAEHPSSSIPLDNNFAERELRTPVLGRKNFQGAKSERGNKAAEIFYSLMATCVLHDVSPSEYIDAALRAQREGQMLTPRQFSKANKG